MTDRQRHDHARLLSERAWDVLRSWLVDRLKLDVSDHHGAVLRALLDDFASLTTGARHGRIAYPLAPGLGKSQAILATITALYQLDLPYPVMVCASRVSALCELLDDLEDMGAVPESEQGWGLIHSKGNAEPRPATTSFDPTRARFLFQTHSLTRSRRGHPVANTTWNVFTEQPAERMVFWDESLLISDSWSIERSMLFSEIDSLPELVRTARNQDATDALTYLQACQAPLKRELDEQEATPGRKPRIMDLPEISDQDEERYRAALKNLRRPCDTVLSFLDIATAEVRATTLPGKSDGAYVCYHLAIPPAFTRIAVLDASYPIRQLCQSDPTLRESENPLLSSASVAKIKTYPHAELTIIARGGGRTGIEAALRDRGQPLFKDLAEIVRDAAPVSEEWLLVLFKDKDGTKARHRHEDGMRRALKTAGVPMNHPDGRPRVHFVTYGSEQSSNKYRDVQNSILVGVLHRSHGSVYASYIGQTARWDATLDTHQLEALVLSECVHVAYQAMHRTRMRKTVNGVALPTRTWIVFQKKNALLSHLTRLMPGLVLPVVESPITERIVAWLGSLPVGVYEIKPKDVKAAVCPTSARETFWKAWAAALPLLPAWKVVGRTKAQILIRQEPS